MRTDELEMYLANRYALRAAEYIASHQLSVKAYGRLFDLLGLLHLLNVKV